MFMCIRAQDKTDNTKVTKYGMRMENESKSLSGRGIWDMVGELPLGHCGLLQCHCCVGSMVGGIIVDVAFGGLR
jgi:hypothetical protein